jgi:hypothetical protein
MIGAPCVVDATTALVALAMAFAFVLGFAVATLMDRKKPEH